MEILVSFYPILYFYIATHAALVVVTRYLNRQIKKYQYIKYLSHYFLWCIGYGIGYLFFFAENRHLVSFSYLIFFISFIATTSSLISIAYSVSGREETWKEKILFSTGIAVSFPIFVALQLPYLLNFIALIIGVVPTIKLRKRPGVYKLVGPMIFTIILTSMIYAAFKTPQALQIQYLLTILFRLTLCIVLVTIAQRESEQDRKQLEAQLHHSEKMEALGQLAGGVAHDFNNMLAGITGAAELLKESDLTEDDQEFLDIIISASGRAANLTHKLLSFSRKEEKFSSDIDVNAITHDVKAILERTIDKSIDITIEMGTERATIVGDDTMVQNALLNMGINASHAMPNGGTLTYTLIVESLSPEYCKASPFELKPGEYLEVAIKDTGTGMSQEIQSKIFDPFFTTKEKGKGTGLGLSSVYGMIQDHHGAITVYSEEGAGTEFHLYFPLAGTTNAQALKKNQESISGEGTILLVEDEEFLRKTAKVQLEKLGYTVLTANDGREGVETFSEHRNEIECIILDMIMPRLNGREALKEIRSIDSEIPVLISSGFSKEKHLVELEELGISGFLHKPFRSWELSRTVAQVLAAQK